MTLVAGIGKAVGRYEDRCAVDDGRRQYTYRDMWQRSGRIARHLVGLGGGSAPMVAVAVATSAEIVPTILGCWRAGGTFVPLEPTQPPARLAAAVANARPDILIADEPQAFAAHRVAVTLAAAELGSGPDTDRPLPEPTGADAAYLLFTSGSTGEPKGVVVTHAALATVLDDYVRVRPGMSTEDVVLAHTTPTFDLAFLQMVAPLLVGAKVCVAPSRLSRRPDELLAWARRFGVTFVQATPTTWQMLWLAGLGSAPGWSGVRGMTGGEALPAALATALGGCMATVVNAYGPTENAIVSGCWRLPPEPHGPILLGGPMPHVSYYPLDPQLRVAAVDSRAELWLGGDQLALGYWNASRLTAERFVPDPFSHRPGARMYRTGDVVRVYGDGGLEFLHRRDRQVKVRGQRIELGAIESALLSHPAVERAAVTTTERADGRVIVGCLVTERPDVDPDEVRRHAGTTLPAGWLPHTLAVVAALPLTSSGKVDSAAVAELARRADREACDDTMSAPRTPTEGVLLEACREMLGDVPAMDTDFFAAGGDSLQAISLVAVLNERYAIELPLGTVFEVSALRDLAAEVDRAVGQIAPATR